MSLIRRRASGLAIWGMTALALWTSFPRAACLCANGEFKFFCAHGGSAAKRSSSTDLAVSKVDCCHGNAATEADRADRTTPPAAQCSHKGCTRVTNPPVVAPAPHSSHVTTDSAEAVATIPVGILVPSATYAVPQAPTNGTGPPVDLVISLHRILI